MSPPEIVSRSEWLERRKALLNAEKQLTRQRDTVTAARMAMPWVAVEADYHFTGPDGDRPLGDLFDGKRQLIVYHFMFGPDWTEACKSCSFWAESFDAALVHLRQRDTNLVAISRAPFAILDQFKRRMGWKFEWVSSAGTDFNRDFAVSFDPDDRTTDASYNYAPLQGDQVEHPGVSVFARDADGKIFHTYSCYARGLDALNPTYQLIDLTPDGRAEAGLAWPMAWVQFKDNYPST